MGPQPRDRRNEQHGDENDHEGRVDGAHGLQL
jgi:hypothetical protein